MTTVNWVGLICIVLMMAGCALLLIQRICCERRQTKIEESGDKLRVMKSVSVEFQETKRCKKLNGVVKKVLGEDKDLDDLARIGLGCCERHGADIQIIWFNMDGTEKFLRKLLQDVSNCGACFWKEK